MLADLLAVKSGKVTKDMLLGVQTISSVPDRPVPLADFKAEWTKEGLDPSLVPDARQPVHVFMKACDSVRTGARGRKTAGGTEEVLAQLVRHDATECRYQITRSVKDSANGVIDHPKAMTLVFTKATGAIDCIPRDSYSYMALRETEDQVRDYFATHAGITVPGSHIRTAVRATLLALSATRVAERASVYFVPIAGYDTVESLQRVLGALYGQDAYIHVLPWLNTNATRKVLEQHHVTDVKATCSDITAEVHNRLSNGSSGKVRKDFVANTFNKRIDLGRRVKEYRALLGGEIAAAEEALTLLDEQLDKLMERVS